MMTRYVLGFLFSDNRVWLIHKERPLWQKGRLNGIGGHMEDNETVEHAMCREFEEEAGLFIAPECWEECIILRAASGEWVVHILRCITDLKTFSKCKAQTDEAISIWDYRNLPGGVCMQNLHWIVPMLRDNLAFPISVTDCGVGG